MYDFKLPDVGEGLAEAEIITWCVAIGDTVKEGDAVAVISTDKVNVDLAAPRTGTIHEICAREGEIVPVGKVILRIDDGAGKSQPERTTEPEAASIPAMESAINSAVGGAPRVRAAPAVRRYAAEKAIDLKLVPGSGEGGLILRTDVDAFVRGTEQTLPTAAAAAPVREKLSAGRLKAAQTLARAAHTMAISTISAELLADALFRADGQSNQPSGPQPKPFARILKCIVSNLAKHPRFNARIDEAENTLLVEPSVCLGIAIATADGLVVPAIANAETLSAAQLDAAIADLAQRARAGSLDVRKDMRPATLTVSNTGGLEHVKVISTTPIINHPTAAMLWISRITQRPWVADGAVVAANVFSCTIAFDHRYLNGSEALAFLNDLDREISHAKEG